MATEKENTNTKAATIYIPKRGPVSLPKKESINTARQVAGKNPELRNLKDHPEFDGQNVIYFSVTDAMGDTGPYTLGLALVYTEKEDPWKMTDEEKADHTFIISTGAENVRDRLLQAAASESFPMSGKFRRGGRAWFLD